MTVTGYNVGEAVSKGQYGSLDEARLVTHV